MGNFVDDFFKASNKERAGMFNPKSQHAVPTDRWDRRDHQQMVDQVKVLDQAERAIDKFVDTGQPAMADTFYALLQTLPGLTPTEEMDPEYRINGAVNTELRELKEYGDLRAYTVSDQISTALSAASMEPALEVIFDKLKQQQEDAKKLKEQMQEYMAGGDAMDDLLEQLAQGGLSEEEAAGIQEQIEQLQQEQQEKEDEIRGNSDSLDEEIDEARFDIRSALAEPMDEAADKASSQATMGTLWGSDPGEFKRLDPKKRLELAEKMDNDRFRQLARLVGPMIQHALGAQREKVRHNPEEIYDIEMGDDLAHILPSEWAYLAHPMFKVDFLRRFMEKSLPQYVLRGTEKEAQGGIISVTDGSISMSGQREIWAMATSLALLRVAKNQNRPFTGIQFGGPGTYRKWVFDTSGKGLGCVRCGSDIDGEKKFSGIDAIIDFAGTFLNSGTDFQTPFDVAIEQLKAEHSSYGAVKGDIVFITDGECSVSEKWKEEYFETQKELGFKVFGVAIASPASTEPLNELCGGNVLGVTELVASTPRSIFGEL